jgi:hypothetical protein
LIYADNNWYLGKGVKNIVTYSLLLLKQCWGILDLMPMFTENLRTEGLEATNNRNGATN